MKNILYMLIAAAVAVLAYDYVMRDKLEPPPPAQTVAAPVSRTISCATCGGQGKLIDNSGVKKIGYRCPVCSGRGTITMTGKTACEYCRGFGRVPANHDGSREVRNSFQNEGGGSRASRIISQRCPICEGSGIASRNP